ncbi:succinate semialdehyde mitochondrial precursor [Plasmopara halstedii]|uniref:Succinate-semialdehyde dehydrogenase, mitochondrial n=1 Tax=Plasmopara halstedii TaxID=4781 RepID=A0A0P1AQD1_PLAHL|nr:succinate semialdehyde mitochondrial precursor [Plasmopara halstedii]CEG43057.1 succinate semialdehyde mitochondrial precursor [Plasmopara halstedii]|eukprot:XP_024579426.1 succinate semialdehyde mitochondrial precursor [Plasmopara halstedii]
MPLPNSPPTPLNNVVNPSFLSLQSHSAQDFAVIDPSTLNEITRVSHMGSRETNEAIEAAYEAQKIWGQTTPLSRSKLLKNWYNAIIANTDDLALIASMESGKPLLEAKGEVTYAADFIDFYAHEIMHSSGFLPSPSVSNHKLLAMKEPIGVCGIITPWNFPLAMITRKLGPCLAAGCTAVLKPAAETPLSALALAKLAQSVGIPPGVINVIPVPNNEAAQVGTVLTNHQYVRKISFTGSTRIGKLLMQESAKTVKRLSLELGGNAPLIVFHDADLEKAVKGLMTSKFRNTGQTCVCSNRIFVHASIYDSFAAKVVENVKKLRMGSPLEEGVNLGPLISSNACDKTSDLVNDAVAKGATVLIGGERSNVGRNYYQATVLTNVNDTMRVSNEEIFGPVVPLFKFTTEDEVIEMANKTEAGLAGYFFSQDLSKVWRIAAALECGMIGVNTGVISIVQAPFGGVKQSGLGREGSFMGLEEYQETKMVCFGGLE